MTKKRYIPCARVSTKDQSDNGTSLDSQIAACIAYIERIGGVALAPVCEDVSGVVPLADRPNGKRVLQLLNAKQVEGTVWYTIDRFYRDDLEARIQCRLWLRQGIELHFVDTGQVTSESDIVFLLKTWQAADERLKIVERTTRGRRANAQNGKIVNGGKVPYSYERVKVDGKTVSWRINESEGEVVKRIYSWYVRGDEHGRTLGMYAIANRLSEEQVSAPCANYPRKRKVAPQSWSTPTIRHILTNEVYAGVLRYGREIGFRGLGGKRPPQEHHTFVVPALVDREMWDAAQKRRSYNRSMSPRNAKYEYLLRGMISCSCGFSMTGYAPHDRRTYRCTESIHRVKVERKCRQSQVSGILVETIVWNHVLDLLHDEQKIASGIRLAQERARTEHQPMVERLQAVKGWLKEIEDDAANLTENLSHIPPNGLAAKTIRDKITALDDRHAELTQEQMSLAASLNQSQLDEESIQWALTFAQRVRSGLDNPDDRFRRQVLDLMQTKVVIEGQKVRVKTQIPVSDGVFDINASRSSN
jgi:site-specific DNA recombinase